jgi:hypothetical protein
VPEIVILMSIIEVKNKRHKGDGAQREVRQTPDMGLLIFGGRGIKVNCLKGKDSRETESPNLREKPWDEESPIGIGPVT